MSSTPDVHVKRLTELLQEAVIQRDPERVALCLEKGADVKTWCWGKPLSFLAREYYVPGIFEKLLHAGMDINERSANTGMTVLWPAVQAGLADQVRDLLAWGADVMLTDKEGKTILDIAGDIENTEKEEKITDILLHALPSRRAVEDTAPAMTSEKEIVMPKPLQLVPRGQKKKPGGLQL